MVIVVEPTTDNIVRFRPIGCTLRDRKLDYAEPRPPRAQITKNTLYLGSFDILIPTQPATKYPSTVPLATPPSNHPRPTPLTMPHKLCPVSSSEIAKMHLQDITYIRPCDTVYPSDTRQDFDLLNPLHIFVCHH